MVSRLYSPASVVATCHRIEAGKDTEFLDDSAEWCYCEGTVMYRLIIVDDEEVIRNGLRTVVDWEALGFTVVGTFSNGNAALPYLRHHTVDVVLADIRMPRLSGLDLARILMIDKPETLVVILSGYDEFQYAQEAIDLNVFKYLLKPIKEGQLIKVFSRIKDTLDNRDPRADTEHRIEALRESAIEDWLSEGVEQALPPSVAGTLDGLGEGPRFVLLIEPRIVKGLQKESVDLLGVCAGLRRVLSEAVPESEARALLLRTAVQLAVVTVGESGELPEELFGIAKEETAGYPGLTLSAAVGGPVAEDRSLPRSFAEATEGLSHRMYLGLGRLIQSDECRAASAVEGVQLSIEECADALITGSHGQLTKGLGSAFSRLRVLAITSQDTIQTLLLSFMVRLRERIAGVTPAVAAALPEDAELHRELQDCCTLDEYESRISELLLSALRVAGEGSGSKSAVITAALGYIQKSYSMDISLDEVAGEVGVSAGYLSRLFKQVTGETFKGYLTRIRMQEAKRLLAGTGNRVYEIAEMVGYNDQHYFSEVFRKESGLSPLEYRNRSVGRAE